MMICYLPTAFIDYFIDLTLLDLLDFIDLTLLHRFDSSLRTDDDMLLHTTFKVTLLHRFESSLKTDDDMLFTHRFQGNITS